MSNSQEIAMSHAQLASNDSSIGLGDEVTVRIPGDPRHLRIVRMVAATFAADAGYSIDDVDDIRMAADEVCAAVLERRLSGPVTVTFRQTADGVSMTAEAPAAADGPGTADTRDAATDVPVEDLRAAILGAVTDQYSILLAQGRVVASFSKSGATAT